MHKTLHHTIVTATSLVMVFINANASQAHEVNFTQTIMHHAAVATTGSSPNGESGTASSINTMNAFLAGLAAKSGLIAPLPAYTQMNNSGQAPTNQAPTVQQALAAVHSLPAFVRFGPDTHTPDPTQAELPFVLPGATDAAGKPLAEPTPGLIFGTITAADETITGMFDDLATFSTTNDPAATDSGTSSGAGAAQQILVDGTSANGSVQAVHLRSIAAAEHSSNDLIVDTGLEED